MRRWLLVMLMAMALLGGMAGCGTTTDEPAAKETPAAEQASEAPAQEAPAEEPSAQDASADYSQEGAELYTPEYVPTGGETAVFKTSKGDITVELYGKQAPIHVGSFVELARKGFYDGTKFHRFEPDFVVQGGDPYTKDLTPQQVIDAVAQGGVTASGAVLGTGGPGYVIKGEFDPAKNPNKHVVGSLGMARSQSPDSAGSQFYFVVGPASFLDGQYTVFGKVTSGLDVMQSLRVGDVVESVVIKGAAD